MNTEASQTKQVAMEIHYHINTANHFIQTENWAKTTYYCPNCGHREVWRDCGCGDYYVGASHLCIGCNHTFYIPHKPYDDFNDEQGKQRLAALTTQ